MTVLQIAEPHDWDAYRRQDGSDDGHAHHHDHHHDDNEDNVDVDDGDDVVENEPADRLDVLTHPVEDLGKAERVLVYRAVDDCVSFLGGGRIYRPQTPYYNSIEQEAAALLLCCNVVLRRRFRGLAECEAQDKSPVRVTVQMTFTGC